MHDKCALKLEGWARTERETNACRNARAVREVRVQNVSKPRDQHELKKSSVLTHFPRSLAGFEDQKAAITHVCEIAGDEFE